MRNQSLPTEGFGENAATKSSEHGAVGDDALTIVWEREPGTAKRVLVGVAFASPYIVLWFLFMVYPIVWNYETTGAGR